MKPAAVHYPHPDGALVKRGKGWFGAGICMPTRAGMRVAPKGTTVTCKRCIAKWKRVNG